jgi:hypothetical protein
MRLAAIVVAALLLLVPGLAAAETRAPAAKSSRGKPAPRAASPARARVAAPKQIRFLGKDPHGPLAVAKGGTLGSPAAGACRSWGPRGSVWKSLDALGQVVGKAKVAGMERYDVTNCDELVMKTVSGKAGVGVYVSGSYQPLALTAWKIEGKARRELESLVKQRDAALPKSSLREPDAPLDRRLLAWETPSGDQYAAVGGRGLTVLRRQKGKWSVVHRITPRKIEVAHAEMYMPLSALDMNGDGQVEIVVHEHFIDGYGDFTLTPRKGGYDVVAAGISGAFA